MILPTRYKLIILVQIGVMVGYALRANLSVAIVAMTTSRYTNETFLQNNASMYFNDSMEKTLNSHGNLQAPEFSWTAKQQGHILSAFYYGYVVTQIPGGWLAKEYGGKNVFGIAILVTALLSLLTPVIARQNIYLLGIVLILEGVAMGVTFPAIHAMIGQWSPPIERTRLTVIAYSGTHLGMIVSLPISGILADSTFLGGWPSVFYVFGFIGILWYIIWHVYASNTPEDHKYMKPDERSYLLKSIKGCSTNTKDSKTPWLKILSSIHVWAIIIGHIGNHWVWYMMLTGLPMYFNNVLNFDLKENGLLSSLPFLFGFAFALISGFAADIVRKHVLSTQNTRRLFAFIGYFPSAAFLLAASYAETDQIAFSVFCMTMTFGMLCLSTASFETNILDISPKHAGIVMGISNSFATIGGFFAPVVTGYLTEDNETRGQYRKVFIIAASICVLGGIFFIIFVSGTQQPWDDFGEEFIERRKDGKTKETAFDKTIIVNNNV